MEIKHQSKNIIVYENTPCIILDYLSGLYDSYDKMIMYPPLTLVIYKNKTTILVYNKEYKKWLCKIKDFSDEKWFEIKRIDNKIKKYNRKTFDPFEK